MTITTTQGEHHFGDALGQAERVPAGVLRSTIDAVVGGLRVAMIRCVLRARAPGTALLAILASFAAMAQSPGAVAAKPAASAASAPAPVSAPMSVVGEWQGPFADTKVVKLLDAEDGVACYFYVPVSVPSKRVCDADGACTAQYPGGVGTVSCVKVRDGVRAPAKAAPKR
jgi:hypothetical protein